MAMHSSSSGRTKLCLQLLIGNMIQRIQQKFNRQSIIFPPCCFVRG